jgi:transitional endoplasmic reticulum ATPase
MTSAASSTATTITFTTPQEVTPVSNQTPQTLDSMGQPKKGIRDVIDVVRHGEKIVIPDGLSLERVDAVIHARIEYENMEFAPVAEIDAPFVFEAAYALNQVLTQKFGWANSVPTPGFFGDKPPQMLTIPVGPGKNVQIPWGRFKLPNIGDGFLQSGITEKDDGRIVFQLTGKVKRIYEPIVNELVEDIKRHVREHSVYRGTAFRVKLFDIHGERLPMPEPEFIELDTNVTAELVLPKTTDDSVKTNIFTPIQKTKEVIRHGIPLKRGILLAGPFGTGKTMIARATMEQALANGWTYVEAKDIRELAEVVRLARQYGDKEHGVVLFCEDIDRIMRGDDRSLGIDEVLNVIDGVESKGTSLMIVLTTNELEKITTALLRPGRLDAIIHVGPPDEAAAVRLARQYGRGLISENDPLTESAKLLAGKIPAVIREIVERSKLAAIRLTPEGEELSVSDEALLFSAQEMQEHINLLTPRAEDNRSETVKAADVLAEAQRDIARDYGLAIPTGAFPIRPSIFNADGSVDLEARDVVGREGGGKAKPESQSKVKPTASA